LNHEGWFWLELRSDGKTKLYNAGDPALLTLLGVAETTTTSTDSTSTTG